MPTVCHRQAHPACNALRYRKMCKTTSGLKRHQNQSAPDIETLDTPDTDTDANTVPPVAKTTVQYHPIIDGTPCSRIGADLHDGTAPSPSSDMDKDKFDLFTSCTDFEFAEFLYKNVKMSGGNLNKLSEILAALYPGQETPFKNHNDILSYNGNINLESTPPSWMTVTYKVWYHNPLAVMEKQLANSDFCGEIDHMPKLYTDFMSGNWAWHEANKIAKDEACDSAMLVPVVLGSDKMTVSVATGNNDFYLLYGGIGNIHNNVHCAHRDTVSLIALLAILKTLQEAYTLQELWDNYGIVGDLVPFTLAFSHANIYEMLSMGLLHQVIKGIFKDHLVEWVVDYINAENSKPDTAQILADID
ncbi:hypothetical protein BDN71DRAFT_1435331 [Pleurotus eryngii]|uniref:Uncharacterized protein n=1 Tax=Pleurotus eryngii TaxID=5323 RepID=A0A9P5ZM02_PLEER|nr:hypothetical protein BDN71DRAFT_1435331 [Pleurotus eryngii]